MEILDQPPKILQKEFKETERKKKMAARLPMCNFVSTWSCILLYVYEPGFCLLNSQLIYVTHGGL